MLRILTLSFVCLHVVYAFHLSPLSILKEHCYGMLMLKTIGASGLYLIDCWMLNVQLQVFHELHDEINPDTPDTLIRHLRAQEYLG